MISSTKDGARGRRRTRAAITTAAAMIAAAAFAGPAPAAISVSPDIQPVGFPAYYADSLGNQLALCVDDLFCPGFASSDLTAPDGEAFYFLATSNSVAVGGGTVTAILGVEAAFNGDAPLDQPITFTRTRFKFVGVQPGQYTIHYPYGTLVVNHTNKANEGSDIGCAPALPADTCAFEIATAGPINNWLKASNAPAGYLGDGSSSTTVTGGNVETDPVTGISAEVNDLTVTGPSGDVRSTDKWIVQGKQFDPNAPLVAPPPPPAPQPVVKPTPTGAGTSAGSTTPSTTPSTSGPIAGPTAGNAVGQTIIQVIQQPAQQVAAVAASSPLAVSRLSLARRISVTRLRGQGLRASMNVQDGTAVVRFAVYKARNGARTGRALFTTTRAPRSAGLFRATLRSTKLSKLKPGRYVIQVRAGRSAVSLGSPNQVGFTVIR